MAIVSESVSESVNEQRPGEVQTKANCFVAEKEADNEMKIVFPKQRRKIAFPFGRQAR